MKKHHTRIGKNNIIRLIITTVTGTPM